MSREVITPEVLSPDFVVAPDPVAAAAQGGGVVLNLNPDDFSRDPGTGLISVIPGATQAIEPNSITDVLLADMPSQTIKGRATAGAGDPENLSASQVKQILGITMFDVSGLGTIREIPGSADTPVLTDQYKYLRTTSNTAVTITIPPNASVPFPVGTVFVIEQAGLGAVTIAQGAGVTVNTRGGVAVTSGQYAVAQMKKVGTDIWTALGDLG